MQLSEANLGQVLPKSRANYLFDQNASYVITGGLGGIGRSIAKWMADHGAKHLILLSRSGAASSEAQKLVQKLTAQGVQVEAPPCDIANITALTEVIRKCGETMPPIRGCIQGSMALHVSKLRDS